MKLRGHEFQFAAGEAQARLEDGDLALLLLGERDRVFEVRHA